MSLPFFERMRGVPGVVSFVLLACLACLRLLLELQRSRTAMLPAVLRRGAPAASLPASVRAGDLIFVSCHGPVQMYWLGTAYTHVGVALPGGSYLDLHMRSGGARVSRLAELLRRHPEAAGRALPHGVTVDEKRSGRAVLAELERPRTSWPAHAVSVARKHVANLPEEAEAGRTCADVVVRYLTAVGLWRAGAAHRGVSELLCSRRLPGAAYLAPRLLVTGRRGS